MNHKRSELDGKKYRDRIRMRSPERKMVCTPEPTKPIDDIRHKYTAPSSFPVSSSKDSKRNKDCKDSSRKNSSGFHDSDVSALHKMKKTQGSLSSANPNPSSLTPKLCAAVPHDSKKITECRELSESPKLKRKRTSENDLVSRRSRNNRRVDSTGSPLVDSLSNNARFNASQQRMEFVNNSAIVNTGGYYPDSFTQGLRERGSRDPDPTVTHNAFSRKGSSKSLLDPNPRISAVNCSIHASGHGERYKDNQNYRAVSTSSLGCSADEGDSPLNMSRSRHLPNTMLENEDRAPISAKSKQNESSWKQQTVLTKHGSDIHHKPELLSPVHKKPFDSSGAYVPGMDLLVDGSDIAPIELISRFSKTPVSSPEPFDDNSSRGLLLDDPSISQLPHQMDSNAAQRPASSAHTSSVSGHSAGFELTKAAKVRYAQLRQQRKRMEPTERQPLPALHLHLSKDGTSPLPPGWQRAPNVKRQTNHTAKDGTDESAEEEVKSSDMYAYYYYHVRTRQTRWDPPVYPWDADPFDLTGETGEDDPEAPYNWGCASKYSVTHEEIEAMYARLRQRILERQCTELLHDMIGKPDAPQGAAEQGFAIELFTLVHNVLRAFRDARCKIGRIVNDEDLYYLTKKLAQAVIFKEVQRIHQAQAASSTSLFTAPPPPELTANVQARVTTYVKRYMESKGSFYRRRVQQPPPQLQSQQQTSPHPHHHHHHLSHAHHLHHHHPSAQTRQGTANTSAVSLGLAKPSNSRPPWPSSTGPLDRISSSPKPVHDLIGFDGRP